MKKKTAVIFAGVDALDDEAHRQGVLAIPEVLKRVTEADQILESLGMKPFTVLSVLNTSDAEYHSLDLFDRVHACITVQVGLYDLYVSANPEPDLFAACSLGDSARLVAAGVAEFHEVIRGSFLFSHSAKKIDNGSLIRVRSRIPITSADLAFLEHMDLSVAVMQTPRHFLVAGKNSNLKKLTELKNPLFDQIKPLYSYPLHSKLMQPAYDEVLPMIDSQSERTWSGQLISAALKKIINNMDDLRADAEANTLGTVHWSQTYQWMVDELGVEEFINIGPASTLLLFAARTPVKRIPTFIDGLTLKTVTPYTKEVTDLSKINLLKSVSS